MPPYPITQDNELCTSLSYHTNDPGVVSKKSTKERQVRHLPGEPCVQLSDKTIEEFLKKELTTPDLDSIAPHLWLLTTPSSTNIRPLTDQIVQGRTIVVTERPELHLIWHYGRVFIKPLPKYILSHAFWAFYLASPTSPIKAHQRKELRRAALGFVRSYAYLIRHRSDFDIAGRDGQRLIPRKVKYSALVRLLEAFEDVPDSRVSSRFRFGEIRLSRLNLWSKLLLRRATYYSPREQYGDRIAGVYGPLLFVMAIVTVILAAFQVALSVPAALALGAGWAALGRAAQVFSTITLSLVGVLTVYAFSLLAFPLLSELCYTMLVILRGEYKLSLLARSSKDGSLDNED
jgi:hypothetical protein